MKNLIIILITLFSLWFPENLLSQGWITQNWGGTTETLNCVFFTNLNVGWVVGYSGTILKTTNGGDNWEPQNSGIPYILTGVFFVNEQTGYISGYNGVVLKTTNGGSNWNYSNNGISNTYNLLTIKFLNSSTGYTSGGGGKIFKTINGGSSWDTVFSFFSQYYTTYDLLFIDANTGWSCMSSNYIYRTSNGGYNWSLVGGGGAGWNSRSITKSQSFFWVCRQYNYDLVRSDNGLTFYPLNNNLNMTSYSISFINDYTGYAAGTSYIKKSVNSGVNWTTDYTEGAITFYSLFTLDSANMWCVGSGGRIVAKRNLNGLKHTESFPSVYNLEQNYPNPFNSMTRIIFDVPSRKYIKLTVTDILGRVAAVLVDAVLNTGVYEVDWDANNFASGVYFYKLTAGDFTKSMKMVLMK